jgi:hypothetical protein
VELSGTTVGSLGGADRSLPDGDLVVWSAITIRAARSLYGRPGSETVGTRVRPFTSTAATCGVVSTTTDQLCVLTPPR